jgi:hypothetical protein
MCMLQTPVAEIDDEGYTVRPADSRGRILTLHITCSTVIVKLLWCMSYWYNYFSVLASYWCLTVPS